MTGRPAGAPLRRGPFGLRVRDARIRSKLGLILLIPLIAVLVLAALRLVDSGQRALSADLVRSLAEVAAETSTLSHELHRERMAAATLLTDPDADPGDFSTQAAATDDAIGRYQTARAELDDVPAAVRDRLDQVDQKLTGLGATRQAILGAEDVALSNVVQLYGLILADLLSYQEAVGQVPDAPDLAESARAVASLSKAKLQMSESQAIAFVSLAQGIQNDDDLARFLATRTGQQEALLAFTLAGSADQLSAVNSTFVGGSVVLADRAAETVLQSVGSGPDLAAAQSVSRALGSVVNLVRTVERQLHADQVVFATELRDEVFQQVLLESVAVLVALVIAIAIAVLLARMLARSLAQLRTNALAVAERELPETVARLSDPRTLGENTPEQLADQIREPIQLRSRDEVGEVAQAFNVVHRAAVRVAAEQAALRTSVSAMFLNLARRSQTLVDRMISQLDDIERNEEDPKRLSRLFALDHLATRMRRNDENLLVLAGADSSPPRTDDALVADVLRAAQSEVEHYARIEFGTVDPDVAVAAHAVNDVVRLVAELFDNATRFSPPDMAVVCEARRLGDQVIVQVEDRGVGMAQDQVDRLNAWLATPPAIEVTTFRKMGLAVVARLASRHQIRVELRCDPNYGTIAYVALPRPVLVLPASRLRAFEHQQVPAPRSPMPIEQPPVPAPAAPPLPARHVGQLPRRSPAVAHHAASRRSRPAYQDDQTTAGNGLATGTPGQRFDVPVAGRAPYELTAQQRAASPHPEATVELPIFKEMEQVWFRSHGSVDDLGRQAATPSADNYAQQPAGPPPPMQPPAYEPAGQPMGEQPSPGAGYHTQQRSDHAGDHNWRTAADFGWRAAAAASRPTSGGSTSSGLPKRVPQAQLVPGSVDPSTGTAPSRRSPEEVRGLLSAYHRGVQRGREGWGR